MPPNPPLFHCPWCGRGPCAAMSVPRDLGVVWVACRDCPMQGAASLIVPTIDAWKESFVQATMSVARSIKGQADLRVYLSSAAMQDLGGTPRDVLTVPISGTVLLSVDGRALSPWGLITDRPVVVPRPLPPSVYEHLLEQV